MTVSSELYKVQQVGNGVTVDIPFANVVFDDTDLTVQQMEIASGAYVTLVDGVDYTIAIAGDNSSAIVTLTTATLATHSDSVFYSAPNTQLKVFTEGGKFPAKAQEDSFDKSSLQSLSQQEHLSRALSMQSTLSNFNAELPFPVPNAALSVSPDGLSISYKVLADSGSPAVFKQEYTDGVDYVSGTDTTLTLAQDPVNAENTWIYFDGVYQMQSTYTYASSVITFDAPIPLGTVKVGIAMGVPLNVNDAVNSVNGQTGNVVLDTDDLLEGATNKYMTGAEKTKLSGIATGAQVNPVNTDGITDTATNRFTTDTEATKLAGIASDAEVNPDPISQADAEAGTSTTEETFTAERVNQAIQALTPAVPAGVITSFTIVASSPSQNYIELPIDITGVYLCTVFTSAKAGTQICHLDANTITTQSSDEDAAPTTPNFSLNGTNLRWGGGGLGNIVSAAMYLQRIT